MDWLADNFLAPLIVALLAAAIGAYAGRGKLRELGRRIRSRDAAPATGEKFTVLVADLDNDPGAVRTKHVLDALRGQPGIEVYGHGKILRIEEVGTAADNEAVAHRRGREWLAARNADVLVHGSAREKGDKAVLRLSFLGRDIRLAEKPYALEDATLELPAEFGADLGNVVYLLALTSVAPATEKAGQFIVDLLRPTIGKVERLVDALPDWLDARQQVSVRNAFGIAAARLGEQAGEAGWLEAAAQCFRTNLTNTDRSENSGDWAATQNKLGNALSRLGERESGTARLEEAVAAYRAALEERTRERVPLDWAATQNNLGNALSSLGERESGTARLEEAVAAYRAALEVFEAAGASHFIEGTSRNLERAEGLLVERRKGGHIPE